MAESKITELRCYLTWMGEDGVARTVVKPGAEIELADAAENSEVVSTLGGPARFALLVDTRNIKSITKEARDFFSIRNRDTRVLGFALIIESPLSTIIGNFFMGINKPRVPVRLFSDERKALAWCLELNRKNQYENGSQNG